MVERNPHAFPGQATGVIRHIFEDRADAGRALAQQLGEYGGRRDVVVLGLPRGGVPVAREVARALGVPLDVLVVRKLATPGQPELAMGAIASCGARVLNAEVLALAGINAVTLDREVERQRTELARRERLYRGERPFPELRSKTIIVVDDGLATGATMRAAVQALRQYEPREIVVAVPVAPPRLDESSFADADRFIVVMQPTPFYAVGQWYRDFDQTTDDEVAALMRQAAEDAPA